MTNAAIAFDTHKFVERLIEAKMPKKQAEVLAEEISTSISTYVATKGDIELLRKDIENSENRLFGRLLLAMIVVVGVWFAIAGLIVALLVPYFTA